MITISLCMIVKNEEAVLRRCLDSIVDLMDEIIIVDIGSTDLTKEIAAEYTDKLYDYAWTSDFADARNFSFSKATMDYIYVADADEVLDERNHHKFSLLKKALLPDIEIVQMKYLTKNEFNAVVNFQDENRMKLFKRLRPFVWMDPVHETVRLEPLVFSSDIEVFHYPHDIHSKKDFKGFLFAFQRDGYLSGKLHTTYAKGLLLSGDTQDFEDAIPVFLHTIHNPTANEVSRQEAACVLAHTYRISKNITEFFKYSMRDMTTKPCSEMLYELGEFYYGISDYKEALGWYEKAVFDTQPVLNVHFHGDLALKRLANCYENLAMELLSDQNTVSSPLYAEYNMKAAHYRQLASEWRPTSIE